MRRRLLEKMRDIADPMLSVGVDLQRMAIAAARRVANRREHGAAFAAIDRMAHQSDLARRRGGQLIENSCAGCRAAVVDKYARQTLSYNAIRNFAYRALVIVHGNHHAGTKHRRLQRGFVPWHGGRAPK